MELEQIYRLPKGYKEKVRSIKESINEHLKLLNDSKFTVAQKVEYLRNRYGAGDFQVYTHTTDEISETHISFDFDIVGCEIIINNKTGKCKLFRSCVVFITGTNKFVDNYKW